MVVINLGFVKGFIFAFIKSAMAGTAISIPLANIAIPVAEKITHRVIEVGLDFLLLPPLRWVFFWDGCHDILK